MEQIAISKFKATCLAVLEKVRRTGKPVSVTRRGQVVAQINPPADPVEGVRRLGWLQGELLTPDEDLVGFTAWDEATDQAWDKKWDERLRPSKDGIKSPPSARKRPQR